MREWSSWGGGGNLHAEEGRGFVFLPAKSGVFTTRRDTGGGERDRRGRFLSSACLTLASSNAL